MKVTLTRENDKINFAGVGASNVRVLMDGDESIGGENGGARPMELLLMGLGGCAGIDMVMILTKQKQVIEDIQIEIEGTRADSIPAVFETITLRMFLKGEIDVSKVKRAVSLTVDKYCSVHKILEKSAEMHHETYLNGDKV